MQSKFKIHGMTCESCVEKVTKALKSIENTESTKVNLLNGEIQIIANRKVELSEIQKSLVSLPKYQIANLTDSEPSKKTNLLQTYKPLILIFTFILFVSLSFQISLSELNLHLFMNHMMGGFFIGLSFFKFLDLKKFAESFFSYDPLAQRFLKYGLIYPFIEVLIGGMYISNSYLKFANAATIFVLGITTVGVWKSLQRKSSFQCACAGAGFSLPLSYVTVVENLAMIIMAAWGISNQYL